MINLILNLGEGGGGFLTCEHKASKEIQIIFQCNCDLEPWH